MKSFFEQLLATYSALPLSRRVSLVVVALLVTAGFALMFFWANQQEYKPLYSNLSQEDAAALVSKLKEQRIPYELSEGGSAILVPVDRVYETRLTMAGEGLPRGSGVGFEIFDQTSIGATEFVQRLNHQRALQGELARTIGQFREVRSAKVLVVMPKDSVFVEDTRPASASVLLDLGAPLTSEKVAGIVHLVANAVETLTPEQVTVVDTTGKVWFKGPDKGDEAALSATSRLDHQRQVEESLTRRIQSMLEQIVGAEKAIVRVRAEMDFDRVDWSEERYDPDSAVVRSRQRRVETSEKAEPSGPSMPGLPTSGAQNPAGSAKEGLIAKDQKEDEVVNYEINKIVRHVQRPVAPIRRLSVAAVLDGTYETDREKDGSTSRRFVPRSQEELQEFENIVKRAMGYSEDREDQVSVTCLAFAGVGGDMPLYHGQPAWTAYGRQFSRPAINLALVLLVFLFVVRPLVKSLRKTAAPKVSAAAQLPEATAEAGDAAPALPGLPEEMDNRQRSIQIAKQRPEQTQQLLRAWLSSP